MCVQQLQELTEGQITIDLADTKSGLGAEIEKIRKWSQSEEIGDLALIDFPISDAAKAAVAAAAAAVHHQPRPPLRPRDDGERRAVQQGPAKAAAAVLVQ